jgi:hypothetical protein
VEYMDSVVVGSCRRTGSLVELFHSRMLKESVEPDYSTCELQVLHVSRRREGNGYRCVEE